MLVCRKRASAILSCILRVPDRATIQRCCAAIAIGVLAAATLRVAESAPVSNGERTQVSAVAGMSRVPVAQAPHLASILGAAAFVALMLLSCGVASQRREVTAPIPRLPFRRRGPPPPTRD
jgi:hypothetical protein